MKGYRIIIKILAGIKDKISIRMVIFRAEQGYRTKDDKCPKEQNHP